MTKVGKLRIKDVESRSRLHSGSKHLGTRYQFRVEGRSLLLGVSPVGDRLDRFGEFQLGTIQRDRSIRFDRAGVKNLFLLADLLGVDPQRILDQSKKLAAKVKIDFNERRKSAQYFEEKRLAKKVRDRIMPGKSMIR